MDILKMLQDAGLPAKARPIGGERKPVSATCYAATTSVATPEVVTEFRQMLADHDWYYGMSDDHNAWRIGNAQAQAIRSMVRKYPELRDMYEMASRGKML